MEAIGFEELIAFLKGLGLEVLNEQPEVGFNRNITVITQYGRYNIQWYKNISTLSDVDGNFAYPFKYIYSDTSYPQCGKWIGFSPTKNKRETMFDREYPFKF